MRCFLAVLGAAAAAAAPGAAAQTAGAPADVEAAPAVALAPEQIHLALGRTPDTVAVQWAILDDGRCSSRSDVKYGPTPSLGSMIVAKGECFKFDIGGSMARQSHHVANMTMLPASSSIFYAVGDAVAGIWSATFSFKTAPDAETLAGALPLRFAVWGDLGSSDSHPKRSATIMPYVSREVVAGRFDMVLHVGDFAYDMDSDNGTRGQLFMREIQNMSSVVPYMVDVGNHEARGRFAHYTEAFRLMPSTSPWITTDNGPAPNSFYYSWNIGLVHFVAISTEIYWNFPELIMPQWEWVRADLHAAQENRSNAPWIVVHGHRPLYCSCDTDCDEAATTVRAGRQADGRRFGMEELFYSFGVDLYICGHTHNYERMYDVAPFETHRWTAGKTTLSNVDMPATTYIITGDAGNNENHETFTRKWPNRTAFRTDAYGYSRMTVYNASHLHWQQVECDSSEDPGKEGTVIDDVWLVQHNHGPFAQRVSDLSERVAEVIYEYV